MRSHVPWARSSGRQRVIDPRVDLYAVCSVAPCKHAEIEVGTPAARPSPTRPARASAHVPWAVLGTGGLTPLRALEASGLAAASHATILKLSVTSRVRSCRAKRPSSAATRMASDAQSSLALGPAARSHAYRSRRAHAGSRRGHSASGRA